MADSTLWKRGIRFGEFRKTLWLVRIARQLSGFSRSAELYSTAQSEQISLDRWTTSIVVSFDVHGSNTHFIGVGPDPTTHPAKTMPSHQGRHQSGARMDDILWQRQLMAMRDLVGCTESFGNGASG